MQQITLLANAKLNLSLDIVGLREDSYHLMDMVNQSISLADELTLRRRTLPGVSVSNNLRYLPTDERNSAKKAVALLMAEAGIDERGIDIHIKKRIPTQSGLGGGSADAAAALIGANELLGVGYSTEKLLELGERVGADVPFCLVGGTARVRGIGERIEPLAPLGDMWFVVMMPRRGHSTRELFLRFDAASGYARPDTPAMLAAAEMGDAAQVALLLANVFDTFEANEQTADYKNRLLAAGALGASLSGSGAAVFGVFADALGAQRAKKEVSRHCHQAFVARSAAGGVEVTDRR